MATFPATRPYEGKDGHHDSHQEDQAQNAKRDGQLGDGQAEGALAWQRLSANMWRVVLTWKSCGYPKNINKIRAKYRCNFGKLGAVNNNCRGSACVTDTHPIPVPVPVPPGYSSRSLTAHVVAPVVPQAVHLDLGRCHGQRIEHLDPCQVLLRT